MTFDCRAHGETQCKKEEDSLSLDRLSDDLLELLDILYPSGHADLCLVGHSLGGAVVVDFAQKYKKPILGIVVVDIVEELALESLSSMEGYLRKRPISFQSKQAAVQWATESKLLRNAISAENSIPSQLLQVGNEFKWRTDLAKSKLHWNGWFQNLSFKFLSCRAAKLLILAGTDRLDKTLMIGQMQGKFKLEVFANVGHNVQEDDPSRFAESLLSFWNRNQRLQLPIRKQ